MFILKRAEFCLKQGKKCRFQIGADTAGNAVFRKSQKMDIVFNCFFCQRKRVTGIEKKALYEGEL